MSKSQPVVTKRTRGKKLYWVWPAKPEYTDDFEEDDPIEEIDTAEDDEEDLDSPHWTCHRDTRAGDLALIYRIHPHSDIAYLVEVKSHARIYNEPRPANRMTFQEYDKTLRQGFGLDRKLADRVIAIDTQSAELDSEYKIVSDKIEEMEEKLESSNLKSSVRTKLDKERAILDKQANKLLENLSTLEEERKRHENSALQLLGLPPDVEVWEKEDESGFDQAWICDIELLYRFENPLKLKDLKADPYLMKYWSALQGNFQKRAFLITRPVWDHLMELAAPDNSGLFSIVKGTDR